MNASLRERLFQRVERTALTGVFALPEHLRRRLAGQRVLSPEGYELDLDVQLLLRAAELTRRGEAPDIGVARARAEMEQSAPVVDYRRIRVRSEERTIPGPRGSMRVRITHPPTAREGRPVVVFFHGGGWVVGSIESHDGVCRALATKADAIVVSVDYALAPEHPFPHGLQDALAATRWVLASAASFAGDARAVAVAGDSAGGNLAAVVAQETRKDALRPVFQLLVYPATDFTRSFPSHVAFAEGFLLTSRTIAFYQDAYLPDRRLEKDPRVSPFFAKDVRGVPPAMVMTAGFDPLRDEGRAYAAKMRDAGVRVRDVLIEETVHGFFSFGGVFAHASRAVDEAARGLKNAFDDARAARRS